MRIFAVLCLLALAGAAVAQDAETLLKQAKKLEARAEKALDQGRNAEAFELLAQAAELREKAKATGAAEALPKKAKKAKAKKKKPSQPGAAGMPIRETIERTFADLDAAIEKGDKQAARQASLRLKRLTGAMAKQLQNRPVPPAAAGADAALLKRLDELERQVAELRKLMAATRR